MPGIYIHIPFCRRACYYCDFHFTTQLRNKTELINSLLKEIELRHSYLKNSDGTNAGKIQSVYFGGGTPSLLSYDELMRVFEKINSYFLWDEDAEITLEANPDDLDKIKIHELRNTPVNRLSIGVQSFFDEDLKQMNRAHNSIEARTSVLNSADAGFENITVDLIYALPNLTNEKWKQNLETVFSLPVNHLSSYCLTVEKGTALDTMIQRKKIQDVNDDTATQQFEMLMNLCADAGFEQYEISNFAKHNKYALHNSNYWKGENYLGIGPSAHSYNGTSRQWNVSDNEKYIHSILNNENYFGKEELDSKKKFNEYVLTSLRTKWGISMEHIKTNFGIENATHFKNAVQPFMASNQIEFVNDVFLLTRQGKLFADKISSELFL
jgi:oxygen-independent coproporphyrinogen III oxidase